MYFAQQIHDDIDLTEIIQYLITLHFKHDYESICKILNIRYNPDSESYIDENRYRINDIPVNKYYKKGIIFIKDENPVTLQRVKVDTETDYLLNVLLIITTHIIEESDIINLVIEKWIEGSILKNKLEIKNTFTVGECNRPSIEVGKMTWNSLVKICKNNGIPIKNGFKMLIISYFNELNNNFIIKNNQ